MATKEARPHPGRRGLLEGDLLARIPQRRAGLHERARRATRHHAGLGLGDAQAPRRARADHPRPLPRRAPHRRRAPRRARGDPPPPPARELPRRGAGDALGPRSRRGRGARARALRGPRGADRGQARPPHGRPARRPDPERRARARGGRDRSLDEPPARRPTGVFVRVSDSDPEMLRYLAERGISPGDRFEVRERQPFGGPLFVRFGEQRARARRDASPGRCEWRARARRAGGRA